MNTIKIAYELLPPPLAAAPAKYWTSISLWLHSYSVGKAFSELLEAYSSTYSLSSIPLYDEAFIIGFIHDLGQKLHIRGRPSDEKVANWIFEKLTSLGYSQGEAREFVKYLYTNPAENVATPTYDRSVWALLRLADRLQGSSNIFDMMDAVREANERLEHKLTLRMVNVTIPQPFLRSFITQVVYKHLQAKAKGSVIVPISTPMGVAVITDLQDLSLELDWDSDIRPGFGGNGFLPKEVERNLDWCSKCCDNADCRERCRGKSKPAECKQYNYTKRDCEKGIYPGRVGNSYKTVLIYYGLEHRVEGKVFLPEDVKGMLQGVTLNGVEYMGGSYTCPVCGLRTPTALPMDFINFFADTYTPEQWTRYLYPGNVNLLMQMERGEYGIDPLCLGDLIIRSTNARILLVTLTLNAPTPLSVLNDVGHIMFGLYKSIVRNERIAFSEFSKMVYGSEEWGRVLEEISKETSPGATPKYFIDAFTTTLIFPYRDPPGRATPVDEWVTDVAVAGLLASWGFYPLAISETVMKYHDRLFSYYRGMKPLFSYSPSDKSLGGYTPYVALTMMSLPRLQARKERESAPAFLEVLDYPPEYSPSLLQYSSPDFYSIVESLRSRIGG